jgi:ATP-dependent DNA helicase
MQSSGSSQQLDQLLLKAESYSHFILENQRRTQALQKSRWETSQGLTSPSKEKAGAAAEAAGGIQQPPNLVGGKLLPYQLEGLQWLLSLWENGLNGILADEMGLGKTIQIISLIAHLRHNNTAGPYLIAGPLATITNWVNEFKKWLPSCPVILYHGTKQEREELRRKHMPVRRAKELDFPIVVTSFEMCIVDRPALEQYVWQYIILDEGHRIKNRNCRLIKELKSIRSVSRLLLTGTPIQNTLDELWSLLNFCSPAIFDDLEVFQSWFDFKNIGHDTKVEDILSTEEQNRIVTKMHEILRPFVLRRLKREVLGARLPPKVEVVVYCGLTSLQREYYARVLDGTLRESLVDVGVDGAKKISQINMLMNLRKVCNHPFLFGDLRDGTTGESLRSIAEGHMLMSASGKFKLLHRMLPRLKREGSKVLIFSQMTKLMDLLEDYLAAQGHSFVRFDGSTKLADRQTSIDEFNRPDSGVFVFLLSTRAGGLGINLTAADTVVLFDSDWNPHQDSQAQVRTGTR